MSIIESLNTEISEASQSTGLVSGGVITINPTETNKIDISAGQGVVVDNYTNPKNPRISKVLWPTKVSIALDNLSSSHKSYIAFNKDGAIVQQASIWSSEQKRDLIVLGVVSHPDNSTIDTIESLPVTRFDLDLQIVDFIEAIGSYNVSGNVFGANGANLSMDKSAGEIFRIGSNYDTNRKSPSISSIPVDTGLSFIYRYRDGLGGFNESNSTTLINPTKYDDGSGTLATLSSSKPFQIQRIYLFSTGEVRVVFGQNVYSSMNAAAAALVGESHISDPSLLSNALFRGWLIVSKDCSDLTDADNARFIVADSFGNAAAGSSSFSTATLQGAYNNSSTPQIETSSPVKPFIIKGGTGNDYHNNLEIRDNSGATTAKINARGDIIANSLRMGDNIIGTFQWGLLKTINQGLGTSSDAHFASLGIIDSGTSRIDVGFIGAGSGQVKVISSAGKELLIKADDSGHFLHIGSVTNDDFSVVRNNVKCLHFDEFDGVTFHHTTTGTEVARVSNTGNLTLSGTVDGVDIAQLKTDFDSLGISGVNGLQSALDGKVDDSQVLTNVPANAVFTDTTYSVGDGGLTQNNFTNVLKSKLDGIENGATADQTKADIDALGISYSSLSGKPTIPSSLSELSGNTNDISEGSNNLFYTSERVDDRVANLIQDSATVTWVYDDTANTLTATAVGGGSSSLGGLTDVTITSVADNQVLQYNGTSNKWENTYDLTLGSGSYSSDISANLYSQANVTLTLDANKGGSGSEVPTVNFRRNGGNDWLSLGLDSSNVAYIDGYYRLHLRGGDYGGDDANLYLNHAGLGYNIIPSPGSTPEGFTVYNNNIDIKNQSDNGNPYLQIGAYHAEAFRSRVYYKSGTQKIDYVKFETITNETAADSGKYIFNVDGANIIDINDSGLDVTGNISLSGNITVGGSSLATVATSGSYNDLSGKPTLATVATSGSYNDLSGKPVIPADPGQALTVTSDVIHQQLRLRDGNSTIAQTTNNHILMSYAGSNNYTHAIKTVHDSNSKLGNSIDFFLWNQGVDSTAAVGTKRIARFANSDITFSGNVISERVTADKYVVQNGQDGGTGKGIHLWTAADNNWGVYMASSGVGKSLSGGNAVSGFGVSSHAIRNRVYHGGGRGFIWENSAEVLLASIASNGNSYFRGNMGIGTTNVNYKLEVNGTAGKSGGGSWSDSSDRRLKTNICNIENALDKICRLRGVSFDWVNPEFHGDEIEAGGFIAQEMEQVFPEWVSEIENNRESGLLNGEKSKSLNLPFKFDAYIVEAIKELKEEINILKRC